MDGGLRITNTVSETSLASDNEVKGEATVPARVFR